MSPQPENTERVLVLAKAVPQPSKAHAETVCCAGITTDRQWRRMFPIRFRHLAGDTKFSRWQWLDFRYGPPKDDPRRESRRVHEDSLKVGATLSARERHALLSPLIVDGLSVAKARGDSLALLRPKSARFSWRRRNPDQIEDARQAFVNAARQGSFLDKELAAFRPPPFDFRYAFEDIDGHHDFRCGDWETTATFTLQSSKYGEEKTLAHLDRTYNESRREGLLFVMGNMKKRPDQWQLLSILDLSEPQQTSLLI